MSAVSALFLAGCGANSDHQAAQSPVSVADAAAGTPIAISVKPNTGAKDAKPDTVVTVTTNGGKLTEVRVQDSDGHDLPGELSADATRWSATAPVRVDSDYTVDAWAVGPDGAQIEKTSSFATRHVRRSGTLQVAGIAPRDGATVGVAQPIVVAFAGPVSNRKLVQAALQVATTPHVEGGWYWVDDSHVHYRPQAFWPAGTRVRLDVRLSGISAGNGMIGGKNLTSSFVVGRNQVIHVDTRTHRLTVDRDGHTVKSFDASTGKPGWETRDGTEVMIDRVRHKHWTNTAIGAEKHFSLYSKYAIRITNSGEFLHDAPWDNGGEGDANTSHGCVALKTGDMKWIWDNSLLGDPVIVTGTSRHHQDQTNTYDDWNISWQTWSRAQSGFTDR
ncbi:MAG TPA: Ig-like domain-containing protein [Sporichthyaceae bacterium]|nr:Ig-like domain-containing protein [Sporichthyaceae bacterium]